MRTFLRKTIRNHRGFTLVEMLAAVLISLLIAAGMTGVFIAHSRSYSIHEDVSELAQGLRGVLSLMTSEFRIAGCDPLGTKEPGIIKAERTHFEFTADLGGDKTFPNEADGKIGGGGERVSYRYYEGAENCEDGENGVVNEMNLRGVLCRKVLDGELKWRDPKLRHKELADYDDIEKVEFNYILWDPKDKEFKTSLKKYKDGKLKGDDVGKVTGVQISMLVRGKLEDPRYHHKGAPCPDNPKQYGFVAGSGTCWQLKDIYKDKETQEREFRHRRRLVVTTVQFRNLGGK